LGLTLARLKYATQRPSSTSYPALRCAHPPSNQDIEAFLEQPVYLELGVALAERWQDDKDALRNMGFFDPMLV
jgi:hypothetical protein